MKMKLEDFIEAGYKATQLHRGTVGDVKLITGIAGDKLVLKTQHKWERYSDTDSWRREYDLYTSDFGKLFDDNLRWPECYRAEMNDDETQIWMEYIDGVSGRELTVEMLELAAFELGRFQAKLYKQNLQNSFYFTQIEWAKSYYTEYRAKTKEYEYIRSEDCELPEHLREMLIDICNETEAIYDNINHMPVVLCHRDFWLENIIYSHGKIILIDWDCTGWGYMFEDIVQLATDEVGFEYIDAYYQKFIPAYLKGFSEYADISGINNIYEYAWKVLLIKFWSVPVYHYMNSKSSEEKKLAIDILQKIYEMRDLHVTN